MFFITGVGFFGYFNTFDIQLQTLSSKVKVLDAVSLHFKEYLLGPGWRGSVDWARAMSWGRR